MRAVIGIGNPGDKYKLNRHNIGFLILDHFARINNLKFSPSRYQYDYVEGDFNFKEFVLIKPNTYVNNSGIAVSKVCSNYNLTSENILVVVDDIYLKKFDFRLKKSGRDGGHNGLASIIYHLNTIDFPRLRIGIGNEFQEGELSQYVLSDFSQEELNTFEKLFQCFSDIIMSFIIDGYQSALSVYSRAKEKLKQNLNSK
ncbi:MAG: aminoacyl-tRNA hydrolase [Ignavibacterium sp.]|nr:aminoacyl-tRNA hydrolase [Ignavibacterium sp.]